MYQLLLLLMLSLLCFLLLLLLLQQLPLREWLPCYWLQKPQSPSSISWALGWCWRSLHPCFFLCRVHSRPPQSPQKAELGSAPACCRFGAQRWLHPTHHSCCCQAATLPEVQRQ